MFSPLSIIHRRASTHHTTIISFFVDERYVCMWGWASSCPCPTICNPLLDMYVFEAVGGRPAYIVGGNVFNIYARQVCFPPSRPTRRALLMLVTAALKYRIPSSFLLRLFKWRSRFSSFSYALCYRRLAFFVAHSRWVAQLNAVKGLFNISSSCMEQGGMLCHFVPKKKRRENGCRCRI